MSDYESKPESKRCCTWPRALIALLLLGVAGVLIWQFAPIDEDTVNDLKGISNSTDEPTAEKNDESDGSDGGSNNGGDGSNLQGCNGLDVICDLRLDEVLFAAPHNAMATKEGGYPYITGITGPNHNKPLEDALKAGYRGLSIDVCSCNGILELCHGVCDLGSRDIKEVFTNIVSFLQDRPTEFLMFNIQINNSPIGGVEVDIQDLYNLMKSVDGFYDMVYVQTDTQSDVEWPTLGTLLKAEERKQIVMFHFNGPNCSENQPCPEGLHYWFRYGAETEYDFVTKQELENAASSCEVTRGKPVDQRGFLGVTNFVTPPEEDVAKEINTRAFIEQRLQDCSEVNNNQNINIFFIDFWSIGDAVEVTLEENEKRASEKARRRRTTKSALRTTNTFNNKNHKSKN
uniref:Phosphatidylinositol-specific phospholipase C X domain-containing protein n=1 Tax=Asterionellopsis glacialis TaxID=33640 RepID=A0A7S0PSU8_9STRA